ncbi:protein STRUBBELIG-RECEPTOR FAMILY 7-like isoform X2 [Herrania umbratica]|uniref:Protein STRUBBELIG-RECEPTOR FAMILY 7-like isoform X2 n=1 Tax=Herrania umbratica TaxID=108875 RepID=A0A6J1AAE6_9ROSI|nr:protein STRUBBELIG-RECEPTOR FAMILY 7-like isoform X2 [Herrania umbratica]
MVCRSWISYASYCVNQLPTISSLLAVHKGKIILEIPPIQHLTGFKPNSRPDLYLIKNGARLRDAEKPESEDAESHAVLVSTDVAREDIGGAKEGNSSRKAILLNSISLIRRKLPEPSLGWPLLRRKPSPNQENFKKPEARDMSVVEWVMSLPDPVTTVVNHIALHSNQTSITSKTYTTKDSTINDCKTKEAIHSSEEEESVANDSRNSKDENYGPGYDAELSVSLITQTLEPDSKPGWPLLRITAPTTSDSFTEYEAVTNAPVQLTVEPPPSRNALLSTEVENPVGKENYFPALRKMLNNLELHCKQYSLRELKQATSEFSPENLIGEGGCSNVYKGRLPGGKAVAVKILKSYKEAWSDFFLEVVIVSSLKHEHITPLIGVCVEDDHLISVYDFFPKGSLEEILHGQSKKSALPWGVRFKVATAIAEALNYLHNECSRPVIHRDVKSSNILLSGDFQPQLSDFGLAIWGPTDPNYTVDDNVVGTFGYIAPEYFMQGKVSDKIDVYSFGVVLLELLSGRRPISSKALEGKESLIHWARPLLERRDLQGLLDPALNEDFDVAQMHRMVVAASLCLNQLDGHRPKVSQVLEILRGEKEPTEWYDLHAAESKLPNDQEDDDLSPGFVHKLYTYLSVSFTDDDSTSECSDYTTSRYRGGKKGRLMLKDYLKKGQDQSLSALL